ncbi:hypothetical protein AYO45_03070 [Gammaproteobacteria bacterium SCGC AG-212-F23]|nr:hypothetical protein AYO45_03070 [Gammaproteobacteria bacterium SCGC AG-212-F23]
MRLLFFLVLFLFSSQLFAAQAVNLRHQAVSLRTFDLKEFDRTQDENNHWHIRMQQYYQGYPVYGADIVVHHQNKMTMNGIVYQGLTKDLQLTPNIAYSQVSSEQAMHRAMTDFQTTTSIREIKRKDLKKIIYIDKKHCAHWAYLIEFYVPRVKAVPMKPSWIIDAADQHVYVSWDNLQTNSAVIGGGFGGNKKIGKINYHSLLISRNNNEKKCYLQNKNIVVKHAETSQLIHFACAKKDPKQGDIYWDGDKDAVNGAYSPANDALTTANTVKDLYQDWYQIPVLLDKKKKPLLLSMNVHANMDNAYWDGEEMTFGDGIDDFYPLVSLGVTAHEISHGFTEQHSALEYHTQPGALNEAFSDMAAAAAEFYTTHKNTWTLGEDILKAENKALRYFDEPTKDCEGKKPGDFCSISHVNDYNDNIDVHYASGIYNKLFYRLSTAAGWDTHKAFDVMVKANRIYWTSSAGFTEAACGMLNAAKDLQYPEEDLKQALDVVGISYAGC